MSAARLPAVVIVSLLAAVPAAAATGANEKASRSLAGASVGKVQNLHGFLLRVNDAKRKTNSFPRTPAFAWDHVEGARRYEFQLSTSKSFTDNGIVWTAKPRAPVATMPITLPWVTDAKYSWFARVRALVNGEPGPWSKLYGFNVEPPAAPRNLSRGANPTPGMVRWTPVNGATAYKVVFLGDRGRRVRGGRGRSRGWQLRGRVRGRERDRSRRRGGGLDLARHGACHRRVRHPATQQPVGSRLAQRALRLDRGSGGALHHT